MKLINKLLTVFTLIIHSYLPVCLLSSVLFDLNVRFYYPLIPSIITLLFTLSTLIFAFVFSESSPLTKILSVIILPLSAINFSFYFIYSQSTPATVISIVSFVLAAILTVKNLKHIALRITFSIIAAAIGVITFVLSLVFAIAIGLGTKSVIYTSVSPSENYRAEVSNQNSIITNGQNIIIYDTDKEFRPPFIHLFPDGKIVFSGKWDESSTIDWQGDEIIINGEHIKTN